MGDIVGVLETWEAATGAALPSMNGRVNPFAATAGAFVGERFPAVLGWCCHPDSHFLRALCTKQRQKLAMDHLVRQTILQRHDDSPPGKTGADDQATPDGGVPSV
jgi:hypothetical protein